MKKVYICVWVDAIDSFVDVKKFSASSVDEAVGILEGMLEFKAGSILDQPSAVISVEGRVVLTAKMTFLDSNSWSRIGWEQADFGIRIPKFARSKIEPHLSQPNHVVWD